MRSRHKQMGEAPAEIGFGGHFVGRVAVRMHEHDGNGLDPFGGHAIGHCRHFRLQQWLENFAADQQSLIHFIAQSPINQGAMLAKKQVVSLGPVDPPNFVHVTKAFGGDQGRFGPGAFQQGVDGHSGAVQKQIGLLETRA